MRNDADITNRLKPHSSDHESVGNIAKQNPAHIPALTLTKLIPPRMPAKPVALDRHAQWIEAILKRRVCLVRAPSGFGKSTVAASWFHALKKKGYFCGWVSFDKDDDHAGRAASYIVEAFKRAAPNREALNLKIDNESLFDGLIPPQTLAAQIINAIQNTDGQYILFLDDYDRLKNPRILQFMNYLVLHAPLHLHFVITCQAQPELPLVYLEAHALLEIVGQRKLRLTNVEAKQLLEGQGLPLETDDIWQLNDAMDGWVTGLRIGAAALRNNHDALFDIGLVKHGAQWLSDYMDDNIFRHLTPTTREFLMRCSIVDTMNKNLCEELSGNSESSEMLNWLANQNLFIQRLDDAGTWYRILPVFREFLLTQLEQDQPGVKAELNRKACQWFVQNGRRSEAITYALEAKDFQSAADLIESEAMQMVVKSDIITLLGWIALIPDSILKGRLPIRLAEAWALTLCLRPQARDLLDTLNQQAKTISDKASRVRLLHELAGIETIFLAVYEDKIDKALEQGHSFLLNLKDADEDSFVVRAVRNATAFCELFRGNHYIAQDIIRPAQLRAAKTQQLFTTAYRHCVLGISYRAQGQLNEAERTFKSGHDLAIRRSGNRSASTAITAPYIATCHYERGDFASAKSILDGLLPIIDEACFPHSLITAYIVLIRIAGHDNDLFTAASLIERAELIGHERKWTVLLANLFVERHRLGLPQTTTLERLVQTSRWNEVSKNPVSIESRVFGVIAPLLARRALEENDTAKISEIVSSLRELAKSSGNEELALKANFIELITRYQYNQSNIEIESIIAAFEAASTQGYQQTIIDLCKIIGFETAPDLTNFKSIPHVFLPLIYQDREVIASTSLTSIPLQADNTVFSILTTREIDVLTGVGRGDTNKQIARELHLTPETVKWHLKNIMRKLSAGTRAEAVRNAATLGLSFKSD